MSDNVRSVQAEALSALKNILGNDIIEKAIHKPDNKYSRCLFSIVTGDIVDRIKLGVQEKEIKEVKEDTKGTKKTFFTNGTDVGKAKDSNKSANSRSF